MVIQILTISQLVFSGLLIVAVLLQQRGAGLGAGFGGTGGGVHTTRRGPEKLLFQATIVISTLLFSVSLALVII
ncbi:MAG: preprotein translocase subunit SecG [Candidatus Magasanikbacteria bacterium RIFCSPHIGHO2_02_FULL_51_14]|uniref:Protein-export membrane protein SecG n=1 Tax=Candidatus Magasanikbacteria bacterium RIFCSPHIGHO2_02_FULL_51_14 TaxID=1798683 RepID=A0A1F6MP72_9BACT|nr:MAG: preprotein translocase subunit SecG [Candidatus Magasanikbacteria bacterium RIFCSPHIGHO2_02_FULL_51_14]